MNPKEISSMELISQEVAEMKRDLGEMKSKVSEMYHSLIGNTLAKDGGIIRRIERLEQRADQIDEDVDRIGQRSSKLEIYQKILWGAVGFAASSIFVYVLQLIFKH